MASRARAKLEKSYEELLSTNENLLEELTNAVQQKKRLEVERAEIFQANDDLFAETERLNVEEAKWENARQLEVKKLRQKIESGEFVPEEIRKKSELKFELDDKVVKDRQIRLRQEKVNTILTQVISYTSCQQTLHEN